MHYKGNFKNNKFCGFGEKYDYSGNLLIRCKWNENKIESVCLTENLICKNYEILDISESCFYVGTVERSKANGFGTEWVKESGQKR